MKSLSTSTLLSLLSVPSLGYVGTTKGDEDVIPSTSFDSYDDLETYWSYLYPWGSDHNGCAFVCSFLLDRLVLRGATATLMFTSCSLKT